jgi:hypothetical protein
MKKEFTYLIALCFICDSTRAWSISDKTAAVTSNQLTRRDTLQTVSLVSLVASTTPLFLLPAHAEDDGCITTPRGIKYKITQPPLDQTSATPDRAQRVKAKYTLYLNGFPEDPNGKAVKIDSSKGILGEKPFEFLAGVSQVIKGWDLTIMDMRVGEARKLVIPADLGYGEKGAGGKIPGGATLYFDVELAEIGAMAKMGEEQNKWLDEHPL